MKKQYTTAQIRIITIEHEEILTNASTFGVSRQIGGLGGYSGGSFGSFNTIDGIDSFDDDNGENVSLIW